jgi:3-oxoacyl-[acyl-carrier-protein] synthase III
MYRTASPVNHRVSREVTLRLTRMVRREFDKGTYPADDPELHRYFTDLAASHGIGYRQDVLEQCAGNTFAAMARTVLTGFLSESEPIDLVIVVTATPDLDPRFSAGSSLSSWLPGEPLVFAISDLPSSAVFTALKLATEYTRRHSYRRVLLLVMEQTTLPYETTALPPGDAAVAFLFESDMNLR